MKIKKVLGKVFPILDGEQRKKQMAQTVLSGPLESTGVVNIHRHDSNNIGDYYCAPHLYFEELNGKVLDINGMRKTQGSIRKNWRETVQNNDLIIGGGGLLNLRHFETQMSLFSQLKSLGKKTVLWGPGHNDPNADQFGKAQQYNVNLKDFGLAGVRDFSTKERWVPCVSCLHPIFDQTYQSTQEVGILFGKKSQQNPALAKRLQKYPNSHNATSLEDMVAFIGASETLVTDSYHAMYWGLLLGKRVLAVPTTTKFFDFKYPALITSYDNFENQLKQAPQYSGLLEECRAINRNFAENVFDYLNL